MSKKPKLFIHMGPHKTGTTTIQQSLWANREALKQHQIYYPDNDLVFQSHSNIGAELAGLDSFLSYAGTFEQLKSFAAQCPHTIIISSEVFSQITDIDSLKRMSTELGQSHDIKIILYLRPQEDLLQSMWKSFLLSLLTDKPFADWLEHGFQTYEFLAYDIWLDKLSEVFGRENLSLNFYKSKNPKLFLEFMRLCNLHDVSNIETVKRKNATPNNLTVALLRKLYLLPYGEAGPNTSSRRNISHEEVSHFTTEITRFINQNDIPKHYSLYDDVTLTKVQQRYRSHNRRAARKYFDRDNLFPGRTSTAIAPDGLSELLSKDQIFDLARRFVIQQKRLSNRAAQK